MMISKPLKKKKGHQNGLKNKVWKNFSVYVRLRDAADGTGLCSCISCGRWHHWKDMDAGHYIPREWTTIWLHEMNVNAQCRFCNYYQKGNVQNYRIGLINKYGKNDILLLECQKGKRKWNSYQFDFLNTKFLERISRLKRQKGL